MAELAAGNLGNDGCEQDAQSDVHEVDAGDRQHDVAAEHHTLVEDTVDQLEQRHLLLEGVLFGGAHGSPSLAGTKLYGGHGPVSSSSTPFPRKSAASVASSCSKRGFSETR